MPCYLENVNALQSQQFYKFAWLFKNIKITHISILCKCFNSFLGKILDQILVLEETSHNLQTRSKCLYPGIDYKLMQSQ